MQRLTQDGNRRSSTTLATDTEAFAHRSGLPVSALAVCGVRSAGWSVDGVGARTATESTQVSGNETVRHRVGSIHGGCRRAVVKVYGRRLVGHDRGDRCRQARGIDGWRAVDMVGDGESSKSGDENGY